MTPPLRWLVAACLTTMMVVLHLGPAASAGGRSVQVQVHVKVLAPPPSFTLPIPTIGRSGGTTYGATPFTLSSPGQKTAWFTTMQSVGGSAVSLGAQSGSAEDMETLKVTGATRSLARAESSGLVSATPRFEVSTHAPVTIVTTFGVGP